MNDEEMVLLTNFERNSLDHILLCCKNAKLHGVIKRDAYNVYGELLPDDFALYIPKKMNTIKYTEVFWQTSIKLALEYRKYLLQNGYTEEDLIDKYIFVGCEKYW